MNKIKAQDDLEDILGKYFEAGVLEGRERRNHDTPDGAAQKALNAIRICVRRMIKEERELVLQMNVGGVCGTCHHRDRAGYCQSNKLIEKLDQSCLPDINERADMLIYDYYEGGEFWVGERFGCIHFTPNAKETPLGDL